MQVPPGSIPGLRTKPREVSQLGTAPFSHRGFGRFDSCTSYQLCTNSRGSFNGRTEAFEASHPGSSPGPRTCCRGGTGIHTALRAQAHLGREGSTPSGSTAVPMRDRSTERFVRSFGSKPARHRVTECAPRSLRQRPTDVSREVILPHPEYCGFESRQLRTGEVVA